MDYIIQGLSEPILKVSLKEGDKFIAISDSMVAMDANLSLKAQVQGGVFSAFLKKIMNNKSFFTQFIEANDGDGEVFISPKLPGDIKILEVSENQQYCLNDGSFLGCSENVSIDMTTQKISSALFGGKGGFFINKTSGNGIIAVSGFGSIIEKEVSQNKPLIVDNQFVVAWDQSLEHEISIKTKKGNIFNSLINSVKSGEMLVNKFSGNGKVYLCSKDKFYYINWLRFVTTIKQ